MSSSTPASRWLMFAAAALLFSLPCLGQAAAYPSEAAFMAQLGHVRNQYEYEDWGVATISQTQYYGHHWYLLVEVPGSKDRQALWASAKPSVLKAGWTIVSENPHGGLLIVLHSKQNGVDAWANATVDDAAFFLELIEVAPPPFTLTLKEPAGTPEKINPRTDFPYLAPLPGSVAHAGQEDSAPFRITPKDASQEEIVANGSITRSYSLKGLSQALYFKTYHDALIKAGWSIEREAGTELIIAHYAKNGRNLWAYLDCHGPDYSIAIGKEAVPDQMKASLATQCHVPLYGVLFDFNKATLQPASAGPLQQVAALMASSPSLKIEVQGHTDNIGNDDYNQKLSEARANAVMAWLTQHAVAADRMTAKGYGKTKPVADNNSEEGRMKNRRVEIANPQCTAK